VTDFAFLREQLPTGELSLIEFGPGWSYEDVLNRPGSLNAVMSLTSDYATEQLLDPWRTAIYPLRDGTIDDWGGVLLPPSLSMGANELTIDCFGWLGIWDRRRIRKPYTPTDVEQFDIFTQLITDGQDTDYYNSLLTADQLAELEDHLAELGLATDYDWANLGITVVYDEPSGVLRTRSDDYQVEKTKTIGDAIRQLAAVIDGFDYAMEYSLNATTDRVDKTIRLYYPRKGRDTNFTFEYERATDDHPVGPTNIIQRGFTDPVELAWNGDGWSSGNDATRMRSPYIDPTLAGVYPLYDAAPTWSKVTEQTTLDENTAAAFARTRRPFRLPQWQVDPTMSPAWGDWSTGDTVIGKVRDGYGSSTPVVGDRVRITGWKVQESGEHYITPGETLAPEEAA